MHDEAHFRFAAGGGEGREGGAAVQRCGGGLVGHEADGIQPFGFDAVFFQYGGDVFALLSGRAGEVVFFEDFVQADAGGRAAGKVEDVGRGVVRVGKRQKADGGQFGRVERGLQSVVVIGLGRAVAEVAGEAGEAGVADEAETARCAFLPFDAFGGGVYPAQPVAAQHFGLVFFLGFVGLAGFQTAV